MQLSSGEQFTTDITGRRIVNNIVGYLSSYSERMRNKGCFVGVFLGDTLSESIKVLDRILDKDFELLGRYTPSLTLNKCNEDDIWFDFYKRFVKEENVRFLVHWSDNLFGFNRYFEDEDDNVHAVACGHFAIIPKVEDARKKDAGKSPSEMQLIDISNLTRVRYF